MSLKHVNIRRYVVIVSILFTLPFLLYSCATVGIEKAKYDIIEKEGKYEIRYYKPSIVAETEVDAPFDQAGNVAFRRLFNYITGDNRTSESISMTAPVNQEPSSEKIKMTAPVNQQETDGKYKISFLMPSKYTMDTLPKPLNDQVSLREIPGFKAVVIRYSGSWNQDRYQKHKAQLEQFIQDNNLTVIGPDIFSRYDPPFHPSFIRRNEVIIPIE